MLIVSIFAATYIYNPGPYQATFEANHTSANVAIEIVDNCKVEDETFCIVVERDDEFEKHHIAFMATPLEVKVTILDDDCK